MFLVDFEQGRIIDDGELKSDVASRRPYRQWLEENRILSEEIPAGTKPVFYEDQDLLNRMKAVGYTTETLDFLLIPLLHAKKGSHRFHGKRRSTGLPE